MLQTLSKILSNKISNLSRNRLAHFATPGNLEFAYHGDKFPLIPASVRDLFENEHGKGWVSGVQWFFWEVAHLKTDEPSLPLTHPMPFPTHKQHPATCYLPKVDDSGTRPILAIMWGQADRSQNLRVNGHAIRHALLAEYQSLQRAAHRIAQQRAEIGCPSGDTDADSDSGTDLYDWRVQQCADVDDSGHESGACSVAARCEALRRRFEQLTSEFVWVDAGATAFADKFPEGARRHPYASSVFCLAPPGDGESRKALYDCIAYGSIPVLFREHTQLPFEDRVPWREMVQWVDEAALLSNKTTIVEVLRAIPPNVVARKRFFINKHSAQLQFSNFYPEAQCQNHGSLLTRRTGYYTRDALVNVLLIARKYAAQPHSLSFLCKRDKLFVGYGTCEGQ
eukprot:c16533_g1_i1.p1 GENE.c16533_g1_i1~~c16533_g1_i1.p1  ORF type:complete len:395 (-),score=77.73 c16533_g1_i1:29-1213(-)